MGFLGRLFGGEKRAAAERGPPAPATPLVSGNRYWRCPACGGVQGKKELDVTVMTGSPVPAGLVACSKCGREHDAIQVYGGAFDFTGEAEVLSRVQVARRYLEGEMAQDAAAVEALLAPDAVHVSMRGETAGAKAIADRLRNPQGPGAGIMGRLQWSAPQEVEGKVRFEGKPSMPSAPLPGITMTLSFNEANKITRIEMARREA
ncbi:MAG TPA: nuclear transport factor 2 family protein [Dehalococcoidia bacterium]|nr:nuclear transport factor 2 family protein [Dehalococcoidia bacterium]